MVDNNGVWDSLDESEQAQAPAAAQDELLELQQEGNFDLASITKALDTARKTRSEDRCSQGKGKEPRAQCYEPNQCEGVSCERNVDSRISGNTTINYVGK